MNAVAGTRLVALVVAILGATGRSAAQSSLFEVEKGDATKVLQLSEDAGLVVKGTFGTGALPAAGEGVRLMWYPRKAAFRAGRVDAAEWDDGSIGGASVAFGQNTTASGTHSVAMNSLTTAKGDYSTALGVSTVASGIVSTALGQHTTASGDVSTAVGDNTTASGIYSTALGSRTIASGEASTAGGAQSTAGGFGSTALGNSTTASGHSSTAMGISAVASGNYSVAIGDGAKADGTAAVALGAATNASGDFAVAMGRATTAGGGGSVALGTNATAQGNGSFAFGDRSTTQALIALENQFSARAFGGFLFSSGVNAGCFIPAGEGVLTCTSSRLAKEGFQDLDGEAVLTKLAAVPIRRWHFLGIEAAHVGPTAEDFHAAFGLGEGPATIATVDANGIALRAAQALERRTVELREENAALRSELAILRTQLQAVAASLEHFDGRQPAPYVLLGGHPACP
jgi:hypothetical protein